MSDADDVLVSAAAEVAEQYGLTADQFFAHLVMGDRRHPDAAGNECGVISPHSEDESEWCRRAPLHKGDHAPWRWQVDGP